MWTKEFDCLTPRAKVVIEMAMEIADDSGRFFCDTGDILLAMLCETDGLALHAILDAKVNFSVLFQIVKDMQASPRTTKDNGETI